MPRARVRPVALTPRERELLRYLPGVMSREEIAADLHVSPNTLKSHLRAIYEKLGVSTRREAVRVAWMGAWLGAEPVNWCSYVVRAAPAADMITICIHQGTREAVVRLPSGDEVRVWLCAAHADALAADDAGVAG